MFSRPVVPAAAHTLLLYPPEFMLRSAPPRRRTSGHTPVPATRVSQSRFFSAARQWDIDIVRAGLDAHPEYATATDAQGRTALHLACMVDVRRARRPVAASVTVARALLDAGADLNSVHALRDGAESFPARALWYAVARGGNRPLTRFLLSKGANPNYCYWAVVWSDDVATARLLARHGANVNLPFHGETPLVYATRLRRTRMMRWLLEHGADVGVGDADGRSPLYHAVLRRHPAAEIGLLLKAGASLEQAARDGSTPRSIAGRQFGSTLAQAQAEARRGA
ncbi:MAG: ankyrin repeat domain-containing protein [Gemmatimonadaceae bacterium]